MCPWWDKRILLCAALGDLLFFSHLTWAANQGQGEVTVQGRIIASACAIDIESRDQTINMATSPISQIIRDGYGDVHMFSIKLVNCVLKELNPGKGDWRYFQITFDGREEFGLFGIDGTAKGLALQISDERGNVAMPGIPFKKNDIQPGTMRFNYGLRLMGNNQVMQPGDYYSTVRFKMNYY